MYYYTGPVYEAVVEDYSSSILGGGRYDDLIGQFLGKPVPAVGCSIGFERILELQKQRAATEPPPVVPRALLVRDQDVDTLRMHRQAERLRDFGLAIETYLNQDDVGKQFKHAEVTGIRWAIKSFDHEVLSLTVRHIPTRQDRVVSLAELKALLDAP